MHRPFDAGKVARRIGLPIEGAAVYHLYADPAVVIGLLNGAQGVRAHSLDMGQFARHGIERGQFDLKLPLCQFRQRLRLFFALYFHVAVQQRIHPRVEEHADQNQEEQHGPPYQGKARRPPIIPPVFHLIAFHSITTPSTNQYIPNRSC